MSRMPPPPVLGEFEQIVMLALLRLGADSYGAAVCGEIEKRGGRGVSVSAVHTTLERLEQKGLVKSRIGEPTPQRGGKRKRHFEVAPQGLRAVQASYRSIRSMADGLEHLLGELA
jgi:PadR family transcriptional regulator PadR